MELIIAVLVIIVAAAGWYFYGRQKLDFNNDGAVNKEDIKPAVEAVKEEVVEVVKATKTRAKKVADVNNDGKVDMADAVEVAQKTKTVAKKAATAVKEKVTKPRKPKLEAAK
jgi:hypothetical protein